MADNSPTLNVVAPPTLPIPVMCRWVDSAHEQSGWIDPEVALARVLTVVSLGFLVAQDATRIVLATTVDPTNGEVLSPVTIPRSAIIEMSEIRNPAPV